MARNARKLGSSLSTKILGTDEEHRRQKTTTLVDIARETINDTYIEDDPSVAEWFKELIPSSGDIGAYVAELFPSAQWVRRYNVHWWAGDLIAGMWVGMEGWVWGADVKIRHHGRAGGCAASYGVCAVGGVDACVWAVYDVYGGVCVLDFWDE